MNRIILTTALALAVASPAFAGDNLARTLGVEPGAFTTAELATIKGLREGGSTTDAATATALEALFSAGVVSTQSVAGNGSAQLAANLGLDGDYSTAELATIKGIAEERDTAPAGSVAFLVETGAAGVVSTQSVENSASKAQLATFLGVNAADYSLAELAVLKGRFEN